jgi:2,5-furandicarboxylate decarboxylase 1
MIVRNPKDRKAERLDSPLPAHRTRTGSACWCCRGIRLCFSGWPRRPGQPLDAAIVVGVDPLTLLASQAIVPLDHDDWRSRAPAAAAAAGGEVRRRATSAFRPKPRSSSRAASCPNVREPEGPFGEFPQYYGERAPREVMEIVAVTHRKDAIFHTIVGGGLEHQLLGAIPKEATLLTHLRRNFPNVLDVHLSPGGVMRFHLYVKIRKTQEGQGKNVILGAFAGYFDLKHVIVVDEDVDIHNPTEVEWAVATRFQADRDLVIVPESQGSKLDPSNRDGVGAKMGLDATKPFKAPEMVLQAHSTCRARRRSTLPNCSSKAGAATGGRR